MTRPNFTMSSASLGVPTGSARRVEPARPSITEQRPASQINGYQASRDTRGRRLSETIKRLAVVLSGHVAEQRRTGFGVPPEIEDLAAVLTGYARLRPVPPSMDCRTGKTHHACVPGRLLVTKTEAAEWLGVSVRTIERLVATGQLPLVHVERAARLRVSDLEAYVAGLVEHRPPHERAKQDNTPRSVNGLGGSEPAGSADHSFTQ